MNALTPSRRGLLATAAGFGLSLQLLAVPAMAADNELNKKKVIVVICRGGMDGLSVAPPIGDGEYRGLRGGLALNDTALPLDGTFALHPQLTAVHAMAKAGEARIVPAVATPDRARSHFEAQDVLETGAAGVYSTTSGWLNRTVETLSAHRKVDALSIGPTAPLILRGKVQTASWSPGRGVDTEARLPTLLQDLYRNDALLGPALARGLATETMAKDATAGLGGGDSAMMAQGGGTPSGFKAGAGAAPGAQQGREAAKTLGESLAGFMREPGGPTVAAISLDGFDSHANQAGLLNQRLAYLDAVLDGVHTGLGPEWKNTVVLVATEFGRTARANGTGGTDHGTGSTALVLGGALKPGGIVGDWPTLKQNALFENRDVAPTVDMRGLFKGVLAEHMGVDRAALDNAVFPSSAAVKPVMGLV
ncbi:DUF1501 domain-containing protein [Phenylobacterium sp.]|jgi:uncharacterized protein (DUF1501 family)|uniref:DUF1501 domain-containing protein n=1 Tax=Phenylobacterium sp. TaxID=1871053 RepID=UPI002E30049D|nr:DUF1501 domain-containing protein [Phenylobacterium sp.]HEX3366354.1 DUF1501 domain-containing protein [Phenylobacterium sp.]